jgi:hypothetical protein
MKSSFVAFAALVGAVTAQQNVDDLPQCGRTCVNNMLADEKASELGCDAGDRGCLCLNPDFTYGVRDCSIAICDDNEIQEIVEFAINWCSSAGVAITTDGGSASATSTGEGDDVATTTAVETVTGTLSTIFSDSTPIGTTIIGGGIGGDASSAVGGVVTTISSGGSEIVSTITSGLAEASSRASDIGASVSSEASDIANSASSQISDIMNSGSGLISSILSTPTPTPTGDGEGNGEGNGDGSGEGNNPETTESDGAAVPQKTAAPLGIIAAAGLAAFLL